MKWILLTSLLALVVLPGYGQLDKKQVFLQNRMKTLANTDGGSQGGVFTFSEVVRREGHRFLFDDFVSGRVLFSGYEYLSEEVDLVIDGEFERLYILFEDETEGQLPLAQIQRIEVYPAEGDTVNYMVQDLGRLSSDATDGLRFYEILHRGDQFTVLHHERKYLRKEEYMENVGIVRRPDEYKSFHSYYLIFDNELHKIKKNRRKIEKALPKYKRTIRQVEDATDNKLKDDNDLAQFFADLEAKIK
jgi:hypothetical protein